jgi:hypothetical protein
MPELPRTSGQYHADTELHVLTSRLPLIRYRDIPRFLRWTFKIRKQPDFTYHQPLVSWRGG